MIIKFFSMFLIICAFLKSLFYGIYEIQNNNKGCGKFIIALSIFALIFPILTIFIT